MTEPQFNSNPYRAFYSSAPYPLRWLTDAWARDPVFRESVEDDFRREASKLGSLELLRAPLQRLVNALSDQQIAEFYAFLRDNEPHRESEFRPDFDHVLGGRGQVLPPPLTAEELVQRLGPELARDLRILDDEVS